MTYARAAALLPGIAGWFRIRAAAVTDDSAGRARFYAGVTDPLARDRIGWSEAAAHRGSGDLVGAAARYRALGARATAAHLGFAASPDSAHRVAVRQELVALVSARRSPGEVRDAMALLDSAFAPLSLGRRAGGRPGRLHGGQLPPRRRRVRARLRGSARHARRPVRARYRPD